MGYTTIISELRAIIEHDQPDALILTVTKFVRDARLETPTEANAVRLSNLYQLPPKADFISIH